jgi:tRNA threonylcarbamoyladenosine biosynthesis protein TsaB
MRTIAIETSSNVGSVACVADGRQVCERSFKEGLAHGKDIMLEIDKCMQDSTWEKSDIELIAVSAGPGSYTGLRVGIAAAKGLSFALRVPIIAVCSLDVIAENGPRMADHVAVAVDARRGEVYGAFYVNVGFSFFREEGPELATPDAFAARLPVPVFVVGDGIAKFPEAFTRQGFELTAETLWRPRAMSLGLLGEKAYLIGERTDAATLEPIYLRVPEAEEKWQKLHGPK